MSNIAISIDSPRIYKCNFNLKPTWYLVQLCKSKIVVDAKEERGKGFSLSDMTTSNNGDCGIDDVIDQGTSRNDHGGHRLEHRLLIRD